MHGDVPQTHQIFHDNHEWPEIRQTFQFHDGIMIFRVASHTSRNTKPIVIRENSGYSPHH